MVIIKSVQLGFFGTPTSGAGAESANTAASVAAVKNRLHFCKGMEVLFTKKVGLGDGRYIITHSYKKIPIQLQKVTWDNYVCIPYSYAKTKGIDPQPSEKKKSTNYKSNH